MKRTEDTASEIELRDLFSMDDDDGPLENCDATHDGEWRREGNVWRFWQVAEDEWPYPPGAGEVEISP